MFYEHNVLLYRTFFSQIYPSEYGRQRMQEEQMRGPQELFEATDKIKRRKDDDDQGNLINIKHIF